MRAMLRFGIVAVVLLPFAACTSEPAAGPRGPSASARTSRGEETPASSADAPGTSAVAETALATPEGPFWPRFHGPKGDNLSTDTGLLRQWLDGGPKLIWSTKGIGHGFSSVAIAHAMIYTDGNIDGKTMITALDMDGNVVWQKENGGAYTGSHEGTRGTPTIDGDRLYHESPLGEVVCLDAQTGERIWRRNILDDFGAENIQWALAESVVIDGDRVIGCPGGPKASVVALDKATGETVWAAKGTGDKAGYGMTQE